MLKDQGNSIAICLDGKKWPGTAANAIEYWILATTDDKGNKVLDLNN